MTNHESRDLITEILIEQIKKIEQLEQREKRKKPAKLPFNPVSNNQYHYVINCIILSGFIQ